MVQKSWNRFTAADWYGDAAEQWYTETADFVFDPETWRVEASYVYTPSQTGGVFSSAPARLVAAPRSEVFVFDPASEQLVAAPRSEGLVV